VKENAKEAIGNLLKNSTKSGDLKLKDQDFFERTFEITKGARAALRSHMLFRFKLIPILSPPVSGTE
jgi:hypothetical protein